MACFLTPMALGVITILFSKKFPARYNINWLNALLWGGVVMLAVEHLAHGEIVPYPPFLTAGLPEVLSEMLRVGVPMALACTFLWVGMITIAPRLNLTKAMEKRLGIHR
ncbi:MAG: hypothetical protein NZ934_00275 [Hadesarchaea archaeon]|nr:hypothetical protein [Hadesarchaea archaeon]